MECVFCDSDTNTEFSVCDECCLKITGKTAEFLYNADIKVITELCLKKWNNKENTIFSPCAFCLHTNIHDNTCKDCLCPPEICKNGGNDGIISRYNNGDIIDDMNEDDYDYIISEFKEMIE